MTDELAMPIAFEARYGSGASRAVVLGGGGIYFTAWLVAYLSTLERRGLALRGAEIIVGTSAGSVVSSGLAAGHLRSMANEFEALTNLPALLGAMAPASDLCASQQRALDLFSKADNASTATVCAIGHAALAAQATSAKKMRTSVNILLRLRKWPSEALHLTATDTYTGERVVVTAGAGVKIQNAVAASSAVPGLFEPQPVGDRRCMDGGVSGSGTHSDLAAGAQRVLIVSLSARAQRDTGGMTQGVGSFAAEHAALLASGSQVMSVGPDEVDLATLMDPRSARRAMTEGDAAAVRDVESVLDFWT